MTNKNKCYPRHFYNTCLVISIVTWIIAFAPFYIKIDDFLVAKIIWASMMSAFAITFFVGFLWNRQFYEISDGYITVRNCFCELCKLNLEQCTIEKSTLTNSLWHSSPYSTTWICIYDRNNFVPPFTNGSSNSRKYKRIQIIYSDELYETLTELVNANEKPNSKSTKRAHRSKT